MADLEATMRTTFAGRELTDDDVDDATIHHLLDVARFAPSGGNRQGWRVVVVRDDDTKRELLVRCAPTFATYRAMAAAGETPFQTVTPTSVDVATVEAAATIEAADRLPGWLEQMAVAPVVLVIGVDLGEVAAMDAELDRVGIVGGASIYPFVHNILLAARANGLTGALTTFLARSEHEVAELLGFGDHVAVAAMVPIGRPAKVISRLSRHPVEKFARVDRWEGGEPLTPPGEAS